LPATIKRSFDRSHREQTDCIAAADARLARLLIGLDKLFRCGEGTAMAETRKLAAILAADAAGYSKLAGADEERTLARLRALRSNLIDPTIAVPVKRARF
jgi:class 3 adenylate cyclase